MLRKYGSYIFLALLAVSLNLGSAAALGIACYGKVEQPAMDMPCHDETSSQDMKECCLDGTCLKCFSPSPNISSHAPAFYSKPTSQSVAGFSAFVSSHSTKTPERPPKTLG